MKKKEKNAELKQAIMDIINDTPKVLVEVNEERLSRGEREKTWLSQTDFVNVLDKRGIETNQTAIHRAFIEMNIASDEKTKLYVSSEKVQQERQQAELRDFLIKAHTKHHDISEALLTTRPGFANSVATLLKETYPEQIIATIAQDDTILVFITDDFEDDFPALFSNND